MRSTGESKDLRLRAGRADDATACGTICYQAFKTIADAHNFTPDFPSVEVAIRVVSSLLSHPGFYSVVAEVDDRVVGSNFSTNGTLLPGLDQLQWIQPCKIAESGGS